jgi:uncharacterized protein YjbJ (UPF0337 family)
VPVGATHSRRRPPLDPVVGRPGALAKPVERARRGARHPEGRPPAVEREAEREAQWSFQQPLDFTLDVTLDLTLGSDGARLAAGNVGTCWSSSRWHVGHTHQGGHMGDDDKARNTLEGLQGKAKEAAGKLTDDERLEAEGRGDQAAADVKQAGEKIKDAFTR